MDNREQIQELIGEEYLDKVLFADGFDDAIIGFDQESQRVVYSQQRMILTLMNDGMTLEDAIEFLGFNVWCAYVGEHQPIYIVETEY
jgi:hypothetical protein